MLFLFRKPHLSNIINIK